MKYSVGQKLLCKKTVYTNYDIEIFIKGKQYEVVGLRRDFSSEDHDVIEVRTVPGGIHSFFIRRIEEFFYNPNETRLLKLKKIKKSQNNFFIPKIYISLYSDLRNGKK